MCLHVHANTCTTCPRRARARIYIGEKKLISGGTVTSLHYTPPPTSYTPHLLHLIGKRKLIEISAGTVTLDGLNITNALGEEGAGVHIRGTTTSATLTNCNIYSNKAEVNFAGPNSESSDPSDPSDIDFDAEAPSMGLGGGVLIHGSTVVLSSCEIYSNTAGKVGAYTGGDAGGVAIVEADVTLTSCKIHQNWAKDGGGLQIENSNVTLTDCHIYENIAWGEGGGLEVTQSTETSFTAVKLTDCKIYDNEANHGGGMNIFNQRGALSASRLMPD